MKFLEDIQSFTLNLDKETLKKYLAIVITISALIMIGLTYFIYQKSSSLVEQIQETQNLANQTNEIVKKYGIVQAQKKHLLELFKKEETFGIQGFLESFCREHNLPESKASWKQSSLPVEGNDQLEEIILQTTFKNLTTQKLTQIIQDIDAKEIVYIKNLKINKEATRQISFDLTLATIKPKNTAP